MTKKREPFAQQLEAWRAQAAEAVERVMQAEVDRLAAKLVTDMPDLSAIYHATGGPHGTNLGGAPWADRPAPPRPFVKAPVDEVVERLRAQLGKAADQ